MNDSDRYAVSLENMEVLRAQVEAQAREIASKQATINGMNEAHWKVVQELAAMKAQPSGVLLPERADSVAAASGYHKGCNACLDEVAILNQPASAGAERAAFDKWFRCEQLIADHIDTTFISSAFLPYRAWQARAALSANHSEQVLEGWQLVPVEPIDAMLEAGDKYIGTPATYKAMLSACPSPAITKDFSQFLSAVMDAAGLIRHGRQSKELSEYLGKKCMEYRGAAPSAPSHCEQVRQMVPAWNLAADELPASGKTVLAFYLNSHGMGRRIRAMHVKRFTVEAEDFADPDTQCCEYSEQDDCYYTTEGWYELIDNWPDYSSCAVIEGVVTHWMPLPSAPSAGSQGGDV
jgi:hypothetical protein